MPGLTSVDARAQHGPRRPRARRQRAVLGILAVLALAISCAAARTTTGRHLLGGAPQGSSEQGEGATSADPDPSSTPTDVPMDPPPTADPLSPADVSAGLLSLDVPASGSGSLVVVPGRVPAPGPGRVRTVRVEVESDLPVDGDVFAAFIMTTLNDPRGWGAGGTMSFARTDAAADFRVVLASAATVDSLCAPLQTAGRASCAQHGYAALNYLRWVSGTEEFTNDLVTYRQYVANHEVGHLLGHHHATCPGADQLAPVMQQQTYGVAPCRANGWPNP